MQTLEPILAEHAFFRGLEPRHLAVLVGCATNVRFEPGHFIFRQNEEANHFYLLRDGKVAVEVYCAPQGAVTVDTVEAGEVLGWSWLIPPYHWHFDARVVELARAIALDGKCLRTKCEEDPTLGFELMKRFARILEQRLDATRLQLLDVYGLRR